LEKSALYLKPVDFVRGATRARVERALRQQDKLAATEARDLDRQLQARGAKYRAELTDLMGRANMRRYRQLRARLADEPRGKRIRDARKLLKAMRFDRARAERLRLDYLRDIRALLDARAVSAKPPRRLHDCSLWMTYMAPYHGYFWSFVWSRSDEPDDPQLTRYLDASGRIGSSIRTRVSGADNDDSLRAEYYTGFNVWHTTQASGVLEVYLAFEFNASPYSGKVTDEFGFSHATFQQWAGARLRVADTQGAAETQESRILNHVDTAWGESKSWDAFAFEPRDRHWFFYRTSLGFQQGQAVLIEGAVFNSTWFIADDQSITTFDDLDLRLERIMVRTCPGPIIL
jgi:hypothetical protein